MARILVIDDDYSILYLLEQTLKVHGHEVVVSSEPEVAVELAREHRIDAVILDVNMPRLSGFDVLETLRAHPDTGGLPVLFLSAQGDTQDRIRGLRAGADDYLAKPYSADELILRIERLIRPQNTAQLTPSGTKDAIPSTLQRTLTERRIVGPLYFGRYQALEVVGEGAIGLVFRGWDPRLKRPVGLKCLHVERVLDPEDHQEKIEQLHLEAQTIASFNHPNIVSIYDVGDAPEVAYLVMEYVDGMSLADYLSRKRLMAPEQVVALGLAIAEALAAAHENRIVHHDVKPGNVLLGRNQTIKVSDFGVARALSSLLGPEDKIVGTAGYLPPETLMSNGYDERGDLFGLGAILWECLMGRRAFGGNLRECIQSTVSDDITPLRPEMAIPEALDSLLHDLLQKSPNQRISQADEAVRRLRELANDIDATWAPDVREMTRHHGNISSSERTSFVTHADLERMLATG